MILCTASELITGPTSTFGSAPLPTRRALARSTNFLVNWRYTFLGTIRRDEAVQRWPEVPNAPQTAPSIALSTSASSRTMIAFLPPISSEQIALRSAHARATDRPVSVEPVNEIKRREG